MHQLRAARILEGGARYAGAPDHAPDRAAREAALALRPQQLPIGAHHWMNWLRHCGGGIMQLSLRPNKAVAVAGDAVVEPIADDARDQTQDGQLPQSPPRRSPTTATVSSFTWARPSASTRLVSKLVGIEAIVAIEGLAQRRLRGGEAEGEVRIALQDELGEAGAEHAHAVEHHQRLVVGKGRHGRIGCGSCRVGRLASRLRGAPMQRAAAHSSRPIWARWRR